jgi:co-chaperonin GroES (HSP10)
MSVIPFQPIGAVVIVLPADSTPETTASGIQLADVTYDPSTSGTIVAVGDGFCCAACASAREVSYRVGDRVLFGRGAGAEIDGSPFGLPGERFLLLQEAELLAILTPDAVCEVV